MDGGDSATITFEGRFEYVDGGRLRDLGASTQPWEDLYERLAESYNRVVARMNMSAARENLPEAVELARTEAVFLERYGRPAAVLLSPERYAILLSALEDAEDVAAFDAAMAEEGENVPWDQVKVDLGWV